MIHEIGGEEFIDSCPTTQKLVEKLEKHYSANVHIIKSSAKGTPLIMYNSEMSLEEAIKDQSLKLKRNDENAKVRDVAFLIRKAIMSAETKKLTDKITLQGLSEGEVDVPNILNKFLEYLIGGPDSRRVHTRKQRRILSIGQDIVFSATSGQKKPKKHLQLGLAMKSLTGSRKVVELLNKMGHCVSYHTTEELETEMTFEANKFDANIPFGMSLAANLGTGVAWDNYDRFVETQSGKDTLHDTVGIAYQLVPDESAITPTLELSVDFEIESTPIQNITSVVESPEESIVTTCQKKRRRRAYETTGTDIQPYYKKPKMVKPSILPLEHKNRKLAMTQI